jgi:flagellar hook-length control protein FliK
VQVLQTPSAAQQSLAGKERSDVPLKIASPADRLDAKNLQMPLVPPRKPNTLAALLPSPAKIGQSTTVDTGQDVRLYPTEPTLPQTWEGTPVQAQQASATARPVFVPQIAAQLGEALRQMPNRPVDIALSPEELGRVRLSVTTSEAGVVVNVLAERQETLDLLRRNIDQLGEEFRDMGFDDIAFSFAGGANTSTDRGDNSSPFEQTNATAEVDLGDTPAAQPLTPIALGSLAGLDLRL